MRDFFKSTRFKVFMCIIAVLFGFMLHTATAVGTTGVVSSVLGTVTAPIQSLSAKITEGTAGFLDQFINAGKYKSENEELKALIAQYQNDLVTFHEVTEEIEQLRKMARIMESRSDFEMTGALIIERDSNDKFSSFKIDKGEMHGIEVNDPVVTDSGLVGKVVSVGPVYARVVTLFSPELKVGAIDIHTRSKETGIITGSASIAADGFVRFNYLDMNTEVAAGDTIITAGSTGIFPQKLIIGTVEEVMPEAGGISAYAKVKTAVDFTGLRNVYVITEFLGQGEDTGADEY